MSWRTAGPALLLLFVTPRGAAAQALPDTTARAVDHLFEPWSGTDTPGCAVGVSRGGTIVYERGFGMANLETGTPIGPGTIFHAASLAKQVTAMAVLMLAREGRLSLDDDVRRYLPEVPDYGQPITVRHLLTHTSGLRDYFELLILARGRFEENRITDADMLDAVSRQRAPNFAPGAEFGYSNTGYALAEVLVRRVSGRSLRDYAAERIFAPLGMSHTHFHDDFTMLVPGRAWGYARTGTGWRSSAPNYDVYGATSLFTTVGDLLAWSANLDRPRVGDTAMVRTMSTSATLTNGDSTSYGMGLSLWTDHGERVVEHEGGDPGFRSYLGRWPGRRLAVAVLCNHRSVNSVALGHQVAARVLGFAPEAPPAVPARAAADPRVLQRRAGIYFQPARQEVVELTVRDGRLFTARNGGNELIPVDGNRFTVAGRPVEHVFESGEHSDYVASSPGYHPVRFEWKAPFPMRPGALLPYAGAYYSPELDATYTVTAATDSTLLLKTGTSAGMTARPVFADAFVPGQYTILFTRGGRRVTGFHISHPRARRIVFERVRER
ncbi:MAG TPA: serine hydrolase domain-containing protein [Longimicrobium sp.]|nr:serine hydrolase domain-containing protein [Longimicrobium sp.]